jgi:predicted transcriptional regulator
VYTPNWAAAFVQILENVFQSSIADQIYSYVTINPGSDFNIKLLTISWPKLNFAVKSLSSITVGSS